MFSYLSRSRIHRPDVPSVASPLVQLQLASRLFDLILSYSSLFLIRLSKPLDGCDIYRKNVVKIEFVKIQLHANSSARNLIGTKVWNIAIKNNNRI